MTTINKLQPDKARYSFAQHSFALILIVVLLGSESLTAQSTRSIKYVPSIELGIDCIDISSNQRPNLFFQTRLIPQIGFSIEWGYSGYSLNDGFIERTESNSVFGLGVRYFPFVNRPSYKPLRDSPGSRLDNIDPRTHEPCSLKQFLKGLYTGLLFKSESTVQTTDLMEANPQHFSKIEAMHLERAMGIALGYQFLFNDRPKKQAWNRTHGTLFTFFLMPEVNLFMGSPSLSSDPYGTLAYKTPNYVQHPFDYRFFTVLQIRAGFYFQQVSNR